MKRSPQEPLRQDEQERGLQALADLMRAGAVVPEGAQDERRRFLQTWQQGARQPRRRWVFMWASLASACAVAFVVGLQWHTTDDVLRVVATRGGTTAQSSVGAMMPEGTELRFSEGTLARIEKHSRAMISRLDAHGATVALAEGSLNLKVAKRPHAAWRVEAGPYLVEVTGTQFDVHWNEAHRQFRIDLHEGSVRVSGPSISSPQLLAAGHTLRVDGGDAPMTIVPLQMGAAAAMAPAAPNVAARNQIRSTAVASPALSRLRQLALVSDVGPADAPAQTHSTTSAVTTPEAALASIAPAPALAPTPPPEAPTPVASWSTLLQAGNFAGVVAEAESLNVDIVVADRPLADLQALADAGRYTGNATIARKALQALRQRFSKSPPAQKAAFELGRLEDDHAHEPGRAVTWYTQYLSESPRGAFAEDALVRLMMAYVSLKQHDVAALHAKKYMQVYPTGGHNDLAQKILQRTHTPR